MLNRVNSANNKKRIIQDVSFNWDPPKSSAIQPVSKFWHLELFKGNLLCNLTLRTFREITVKRNTLYIHLFLRDLESTWNDPLQRIIFDLFFNDTFCWRDRTLFWNVWKRTYISNSMKFICTFSSSHKFLKRWKELLR